jgi:hypothetical protein
MCAIRGSTAAQTSAFSKSAVRSVRSAAKFLGCETLRYLLPAVILSGAKDLRILPCRNAEILRRFTPQNDSARHGVPVATYAT